MKIGVWLQLSLITTDHYYLVVIMNFDNDELLKTKPILRQYLKNSRVDVNDIEKSNFLYFR